MVSSMTETWSMTEPMKIVVKAVIGASESPTWQKPGACGQVLLPQTGICRNDAEDVAATADVGTYCRRLILQNADFSMTGDLTCSSSFSHYGRAGFDFFQDPAEQQERQNDDGEQSEMDDSGAKLGGDAVWDTRRHHEGGDGGTGKGFGERESAGGGCARGGDGDGGEWGKAGEGRGIGEEFRGAGIFERGVGGVASVAAGEPAFGVSGEASAEADGGDVEGADESAEFRPRESAMPSELDQCVSALRIAELHDGRGDDGSRELKFAMEDGVRSVADARSATIAQEFAHHKPGLARLNNGSFGSCPQSVLAAQTTWSEWWLRQPDEFYFGPLEEGLHHARKEVADLIHAPVEEVVLLENVTAVASMVALDVMWAFAEGRYNKGDSILILNFTYGAVKKAFKAYALRAGARVFEVTIPFPVASNQQILRTFEEALKKEKESNPSGQIRLAVFDHIVSMPTMVLPICELVKLCRSYGVEQIFIDGAHGIGNLELNMKEIDADYYTSNLHKWMFASTTAAFLHCKPQHLCRLHHPIISHLYGMGLVGECSWLGTRDYSALLAVPAAIKFVKDVAGTIEDYRAKNHHNVIIMAEMLASAWGTHLGTPPDMCAAMAMVALPPAMNIQSQADIFSLRKRLREEYYVEVHLFYSGVLNSSPQDDLKINGYVRISHQIYNKSDEYLKLRDAVNDIVLKNRSCQ